MFRFRSLRLSIAFAGKLLLGQFAARAKADAVAAVAWFIPAACIGEGRAYTQHCSVCVQRCMQQQLELPQFKTPVRESAQVLFHLCMSGSQICSIPHVAGHAHRVLADVASVSLAVFLAHVALLYCFNLTCTSLPASSHLDFCKLGN